MGASKVFGLTCAWTEDQAWLSEYSLRIVESLTVWLLCCLKPVGAGVDFWQGDDAIGSYSGDLTK